VYTSYGGALPGNFWDISKKLEASVHKLWRRARWRGQGYDGARRADLRGRGGLRSEAAGPVGHLPRHGAELVLGEAPLRHHPPRDVAHLLQVARRACGDLFFSVHKLLDHAAGEGDGKLALPWK
jgi:hypothetical protein